MGGFGLRFFESFHFLHMISLHFCASPSRLRRTERTPLMPLLPMQNREKDPVGLAQASMLRLPHRISVREFLIGIK